MSNEWPLLFYQLLVLGLALSIVVPDRVSPSSRALAAGLALTVVWQVPLIVLSALGCLPLLHSWPLEIVPAEFGQIAFAEWLLLVLRTAPQRDRWSRAAEYLLRFCQISQVIVIPIRIIYADELPQLAAGGIGTAGAGSDSLLVLLHALLLIGMVTFALPMLILLFRQPDAHERQRVLGLLAGAPFFIASTFVQQDLELWVLLRVIGILVALVGITKYHVMQGQRGAFLSRFLSPEVSTRVRAHGFLRALDQSQLEITVVCCDLRGFTAYSMAQPVPVVVNVLHDYYDVASAEVAKYGGTIKDLAGDGILILVGAPQTFPDHAQRAVDMARSVREAVAQALQKWRRTETPLGLGIGIASGVAIVGVIDAAFRLEYAAIGPTVNLAARLCALAKDGEIVVSERTSELTGAAGLEACEPVALKGIGDAVPHFKL
jgi:adenylate cyclase